MTKPNETAFLPQESQVPQDWRGLADHLAKAGLVLDLSTPPAQFAGGFGNLNYKIMLDGKPAVLRRPPPGPLPPGANDMAREGRILRGLEGHFPLAPRCLHLHVGADVLGAPFLIMDYRPGIVIGGALPDHLAKSPEIGATLAEMLAEVLSSLHAVDPAAAGLDTLGRPEGFLSRTARGWAMRAELAWDGTAPTSVGEIQAWLERNPVQEGKPVLLHNDFKLDNIILDPVTLKPRALIDWDLGTRGDPLWDLAVLLSYWAEPDDPSAMLDLGQMPTTAPGFPSRAETIARYDARSGRDVSGIRQYRVVAQFRLAVVFRQIFNRYRDSGEENPRAGAFDVLADGILDCTMDIMAGRVD
ncbi:MAG: phosphotransferase family protein [Alphaproteobacteria bacterium]|nr:phosphotransferase family protein [Alphaproteobacteria bacterium]